MSWEQVRELVTDLALIASSYDMQLRSCSQEKLLIPGIIEEARCVDANRIERVSGKPIAGKTRQKGNRKECGCFASKDIGEYDTCPHGCVYCYAVQNRELALSRYKKHDPTSDFLFPPKGYNAQSSEDTEKSPIIPLPKSRKSNKSDTSKDSQKNSSIEVEQQHLF